MLHDQVQRKLAHCDNPITSGHHQRKLFGQVSSLMFSEFDVSRVRYPPETTISGYTKQPQLSLVVSSTDSLTACAKFSCRIRADGAKGDEGRTPPSRELLPATSSTSYHLIIIAVRPAKDQRCLVQEFYHLNNDGIHSALEQVGDRRSNGKMATYIWCFESRMNQLFVHNTICS